MLDGFSRYKFDKDMNLVNYNGKVYKLSDNGYYNLTDDKGKRKKVTPNALTQNNLGYPFLEYYEDEEWKHLVSFKHWTYSVSNYGRIKRDGNYYTEEKLCNTHKDTGGYSYCRIGNITYYIHRSVALKFNGHPKEQVHHVDGDIDNNHYSNLEWVSREEHFYIEDSLGSRDNFKYSKPKLTEADKDNIKSLSSQGLSYKELSNIYGVSKQTIYNICKKPK